MNSLSPYRGRWWHEDPKDGRIVCDLCPRQCRMKEGDRGFCFVRKIEGGEMILDTYGRSTGFCIDPIEKKPLNHFLPGTSVLSFGTAGCNLGCQFCQNWDISKSKEVTRLSAIAEPETIALAASEMQCRSVAFTYNDPVIWAEYAIDSAKACHDMGIKTVAVTAGYMSPTARREFYEHIDAANVDLKAFSEDFYRKITYSHLEPVLDTLRFLKFETDVWFEITNLIIPDCNDSDDELKQMCDWITAELGPDVPVHFSAFHPDFRMMNKERTSHETLIRAHEIAKQAGLRYPYVGNVHDVVRGSTFCWKCKALLIERDWYELGRYDLQDSKCSKCKAEQAGRFESLPGDWGRRRLPVNLDAFRAKQSRPSHNAVSLPLVSIAKKSNADNKDEVMSRMPPTVPVKLEMLTLSDVTDEQKLSIQKAAQHVLCARVLRQRLSLEAFAGLDSILDQHVMGVFTTVKRQSTLRGCCGFLGKPTPLREAIITAAERTATEDNRMPPISSVELEYVSLHVTLLASPIPVDGPAADRSSRIEIGKHGVRITSSPSSPHGQRAALFLPIVPVEQGWDVDEYLAALCRKAGLPENAWTEASTMLETFEGLEIDGNIDRAILPDPIPIQRAPGDLNSLIRLKQAAVQNMIAMSQGATPSYYVPDAMEGNVQGLVLSAVDVRSHRAIAHWIQMSLRPGIGLQSSLFELSRLGESTLRNTKFSKNLDVELEVTVLHDPVQHGLITAEDWDGNNLRPQLSDCDLRGVLPTLRAIFASSGKRVAVAFDANKPVGQLVDEAARAVRSRNNPIVIFSLGCVSTANALLASNQAVADPSDEPRKPAVGDAFYPASATERQSMLKQFIDQTGSVEKVNAMAIMTPHAGLRFSGQIATDVWSRVEMPETVLIVGPKHTSNGVDWAVSPSREWTLPESGVFEADLELAKTIVERVQGMEFDSSAHALEHGIEVQLPVLEAIQTERALPKIVAVAMGGASWAEIQTAASQLAAVLQELETMPLLVISSDMNHFATDPENRRLDAIALEAMMTGDPQHLLDTCRLNSISMCGVVPAALIMQTLIEMNKPFRIEKVSYETSIRAGGDRNRVVGYAGMVILPTADQGT